MPSTVLHFGQRLHSNRCLQEQCPCAAPGLPTTYVPTHGKERDVKRAILVYLFSAAFGSSLFGAAFTVSAGPPLDSTSTAISILNDNGFDLLRVTFDLTGTSSALILSDEPGSIFNLSGPPGGTATPFMASPVAGGFLVFGFDFTSFNTGETFSFSWDPDIVGDAAYGAVISEFAGIDVTLLTSGGTVSGTMAVAGDQVLATINSPGDVGGVPEPSTWLLMASGVLGIAGVRFRQARR